MGRMNQSTFKTLFEYGKKVYQGELDLGTAAAKANAQNPEVAVSSARHYITWYSKMKTGEFLTWNTNSDLLLYYVKRIMDEEGIAAGQLAIQSAKQFAKHVARHDLEEDLDHLAAEKGILPVGNTQPKGTQTQKEAFQKWLKGLATRKYTEGTIYRYTRALEMAEEWLSIKLPCPVFMIASIEEFERCNQIIKSVPNFAAINEDHGHGDLSAALSLYAKFLVAQTRSSSDWWPSLAEYDPKISKRKWLELLNAADVLGDNIRRMFAAMYAQGGAASCAQLAEQYGKTANHYIMTAVHAAESVAKATGCPLMQDNENSKLWPIFFVGRNEAKTDRYIWKIRDELFEALDEYEIGKYLNQGIVTGSFDSWEIIDEHTAIKHCDKSFFDYRGSGVPKGICWFFDAEDMEPGGTRVLKLIYNGVQYQGSVKNETTDRRRVRIFWSVELGNLFNTFNVPDATATFKKISANTYEVTMKGGETEMTIKEKVDAIKAYIAVRGFNYEGDLIENFYLSLKSKPFVILAGTSGTGKTRLVKLFAEAIGAQMKLVPVRPDWSDSSDLFGHTDLSGNFHLGAIIDFVKRAEWNKDTPHFLCLDEMNLARVEYYLSDFLSIIETRDRKANGAIETDPLVDDSFFQSQGAKKKYGRVYLPDNLYIIGTVNMDETTFPFSKKVLDRANTIEFSFVNLMVRAAAGSPAAPQKLDNAFLKTDYLYLQDCDDEDLVDGVCFNLEELNQILVKANLHVGYRVRDEVCFYMMNNKKAGLLPDDAAFDHEIMQKILPRIQGSSAAIKEVLSELFIKCAGDYSGFAGAAAYEQMGSFLDSKPCKYPNSAKKIAFMMRRYEEDGFTSYWL